MQTVNNLFLSVSIFEVLIETTSCNFMFLYELAKSWKREKRFKKITDSRNFPSTKRRPKTNFHQQRTASQKADINQTQEHTAYDEMQTVIKFCLISMTTDLLGLTTDRTFILIIEVIFTLHIKSNFFLYYYKTLNVLRNRNHDILVFSFYIWGCAPHDVIALVMQITWKKWLQRQLTSENTIPDTNFENCFQEYLLFSPRYERLISLYWAV